ncbi:glutamine--fructose-6-phosphate transaminase (isomerizing) [Chelatococcus composti]|jgi:glucosamine--fructose-6-phosphate aminotransferase (isomerizing)|uniref:Glutamine--fructose-6-phosphate aminotransferase [isomerizing] n=1 Tax=Chelatococcus composti TaxID=1743235 RepID=A0A841KC48_9HYPH|nr:glutamine--fructose-6-phosphate transaminase (isomerizing) [Chelatococcus composti]MBB6166839.1 glucosamine--fructose-6-phosphate aminotransferase (isomerizing) [Chelatococcus composti]MBS7734235.1 glutamine--fructose-6-phosphate transaminase (isomerizing) [Chelatococcus composti]PZN43668.1 MAG: glutamine--fructose-6-phosphate transaminase (isomerizing) [Pseudomonadota bacterium]GGG25430.1 glutamine--fructose-6-phosphate aminotransferase [isomerizing] [Chelatococcus composti]
MCGIVGILGRQPAAPLVVDALKRLEYRGYDSAGVATLENGRLERRRAEGKLRNLEEKLARSPLSGPIGIGHTRWATHGRPNETNAHPHATDRLAVVHNGIIENFRTLKEELQAEGVVFETETDTEVVAQLVTREMRAGRGPVDAVAAVLPRLRGAFALAFLFAGEEDLLIGARHGAPLAIGYGDGEMYLGSDALALAPLTDEICYLEDGDWVVLSHQGAVIRDMSGKVVQRERQRFAPGAFIADKGNHRHFMAKEIHEQPEVVGRTIAHYVDLAAGRIKMPAELDVDFRKVNRLVISACGTAYYAGLVARYWFERLARLPVEIDVASEFRYRETPLFETDLALFISQSGETADTLASLRYARASGAKVLSVVNVPTSTIARESTAVLPTLAGPEIGVASTKAFTCQLAVLLALAIAAGRARGTLSERDEEGLVSALVSVPGLMAEALKSEPEIEGLARELSKARDVLYLGRGMAYPLALEGALKLKEISYIHAEGYAAGELKHGPIALIDETVPVIVLAPNDAVFEKTVSNMQEVAARGGRIILVGEENAAREAAVDTMATIAMPAMNPIIAPMVYAVPAQLIAYHTALFMGKDVDQPRNLAKSVTVE